MAQSSSKGNVPGTSQGQQEAAAPLVPADVDLAGLSFFPINVERLMASELWALSTPEEMGAAMALWIVSYRQTPAGSLPNDERVLAAFSRAGARWPKVRSMALRGWRLATDGRLYHQAVADAVLAIWAKRLGERQRKRQQRAAVKHHTKPLFPNDVQGRPADVTGTGAAVPSCGGGGGGGGERKERAHTREGKTANCARCATPAPIGSLLDLKGNRYCPACYALKTSEDRGEELKRLAAARGLEPVGPKPITDFSIAGPRRLSR